ncbi:MAG: hypothetical protein JRH07_18835, partial [Deltaproteobacteria bacterium]|nr:hypothetical protein [Deltaproteobacteria bacterium]
MRIAILGAGNGGKAAAADLTLAGHTVSLFEFPRFDENLRDIRDTGGLALVGAGRQGFAKLDRVTTSIEEALEGAEMILPVLTAFGHGEAARACAPHLVDGQTVVLTPGSSLGSLHFYRILEKEGVKADVGIGEVHTLPYAARRADGEIRILLGVKKLWLAAFPARNTPDVLEKFRSLYPVAEPQKNILEVALNNGNPVTHPVPSLLNAGRVEYSGGEFYLYAE